MTQTEEKDRRARWRLSLDAHGAEHGTHLRLGDDHGALFTEDGETLLVTFERAEAIRDNAQGALPFGLQIAGRDGASQLCLYSESDGFFRDQEVFAYFDNLVDEGFFDQFDRVVFYGCGPCGYAAAAFSVCAPGATAVLLRPLATLDTARAGWDNRYGASRRADFVSRYGYAPAMLEAADAAFLLYNPANLRDAMHAALFVAPNTHAIRTRWLSPALDRDLEDMGVLAPALRAALRGRLTAAHLHQLLRARHGYGPWLRRLVVDLERSGRPWLTGLAARAAHARFDWPRIAEALATAEAALDKEGRALPPPGPSIGKEAAE